MHEYDLIAAWYASRRLDGAGVPEVTALASSLARRSRVLDVGCGNGIPLTRVLLETGHTVVGLDSSREMLLRFRQNCPTASGVRGIVQRCPFADASFDAAISYGVMFHLTREEQLEAYASVSRVLRPGAMLLCSSPDERHDTGTEGTMNGVTFRYFPPFGKEQLRAVMAANGFAVVDVHTDKGDNTFYLLQKIDQWCADR